MGEVMTTLEKILDGLGHIEEGEIEQTANALGPILEGEELYCHVQSKHARALWTLANKFDREAAELAIQARFGVAKKNLRRTLNIRAQKAAALAEVARSLAWAEMRDEAPDGVAWWSEESSGLGLREDFALVSTPEVDAPSVQVQIALSTFVEMLRGRLDRGLLRDDPAKKSEPN